MADLYWGQTKLLLHCDGADGSVMFADEAGKTVTAFGNAQIDTAQSKFGGASALFDGSGDYLSTPNTADWNFGSGDFTVEAWLRLTASPTAHSVIACIWPTAATSAWRFLILDTGRLHFNWTNSIGQNRAMSSVTSPAPGEWVHVAISREGNTFRLFVGGALESSATYADEVRSSGGALNIGRNDESAVWYLSGHLDDVRITKGIARYTASFTPPASAHPSGYLVEQPEAPVTVTVSHTTEQPEAPVTVTVYTTEQPEAPVAITVSHTTEQPEAPVVVTVTTQTEQPEAAISVVVARVTEQPDAAIRVMVRGTEQPEAAVAIAVTDGQTSAWGVRVLLDGVAVDDVVPPLSVRAEEGAARIASFGLMPPAGAVNPISYVGRQVQIDLLRGGIPLRLFTGRIDLPDYDPIRRIIRLSCTDDLQNRLAALSRAEIDALTGGGYHRAVHGDIDDNWDYAQACMLTHPASLDAAPHGGLRVTPWEGLSTWQTFDTVLDGTYGIELPRRQDILNRVDVNFGYRYHRLRERRIGVSWHMAWFSNEAEASGFQWPTIGAIQSAIRGAGWTVLSEVYYPCPAQVNYTGGTVKTSGETDSMAAVLALRYGQTITEATAMTVTAPESIAGNGELAQALRCTLASEWTPDEWESDYDIEPIDAGDGLDYAPDANRADAAAGMQSALDQAKTLILARHRHTRVTFDLPCMPEIDLDRAIALDLPGLACAGKVWAVEHRLDTDAGQAISRVTLALSGVAAAGLATPTPNPLTPPEPPDLDEQTGPDSYDQPHMAVLVAGMSAYSASASGWLILAPETINVSTGAVTNPWYSPGATYPETGFRMLLSGVPDSHRQPAETTTQAAYEVVIPEDSITLS